MKENRSINHALVDENSFEIYFLELYHYITLSKPSDSFAGFVGQDIVKGRICSIIKIIKKAKTISYKVYKNDKVQNQIIDDQHLKSAEAVLT